MKNILTVVLFVVPMSVHAFQCGPFTVSPDRYMTTINHELQDVTSVNFRGYKHDYSQVTITLRPRSITTTDRQYWLKSESGNATLELLTRENPPRVLNHEVCDSGLSGFNW